MKNEKLKILYDDNDLLVIDKPAGINADDIPGRVHRLDKDTSGVLLVAKNDKTLEFLQKQFSAATESYGGQAGKIVKKYVALIVGYLKNNGGAIETLIGRSPKDKRKQKVYLPNDPRAGGKRIAITKYAVLKRFVDYDLIEVEPKTGRKHQIRCHFAHLGHPIAGDKMYGFKNQICPQGLKRQFLHASYLKIKLPDEEEKEFTSELPNELQQILKNLI